MDLLYELYLIFALHFHRFIILLNLSINLFILVNIILLYIANFQLITYLIVKLILSKVLLIMGYFITLFEEFLISFIYYLTIYERLLTIFFHFLVNFLMLKLVYFLIIQPFQLEITISKYLNLEDNAPKLYAKYCDNLEAFHQVLKFQLLITRYLGSQDSMLKQLYVKLWLFLYHLTFINQFLKCLNV